ncbi:SET and MYND domain-containing protein 4-like [Lutzomyia longipalpis]|uniref:SET and MYND domain-containing protein 4-like n=1 Tax=Lutzomyia longipalpis TaxID=7200 RepID=UPI0024844C58|nr:SET and MYND domain-containing protein 4-like [Lutzomyia longipalpis]
MASAEWRQCFKSETSEGIYANLIRSVGDDFHSMFAFHFNLFVLRECGDPIVDTVDMALEMLSDNDLFPDVQKLAEEKSDAKAEEFRLKGNAFFKYKKNVKAIEEYNKSACYAVSKEKISLAIANRSAVFFEMRMFRECLESIRMAREFGYPERLKEKLDRREANCKESLEEREPPRVGKFKPKIDLPVNEKIPFVAKCLALRHDRKYGRKIVTTKEIHAGTIIAIDEPFSKVLLGSTQYMRCATCLVEVPHLLFACNQCTQTMFCSQACQEEAMKDFHVIECPINGALFKIFDMGLRIVFRTVISAFLLFADPNTMAGAVMKIERERKNVFNFDWSGAVSAEQRYAPIHNMLTKEKKLKENSDFKNHVNTALIFNLLKNNSSQFSQRFLTSDKAEKFLKKIIFRYVVLCPMNAYSFDTIMENEHLDDFYYGGGMHGFRTLINHSCNPNICINTMGTRSVVMTVKKIVAGEQLFANYSCNFKYMEKSMRQLVLHKQHDFHCECVACTKNFPMLPFLREPKTIPKVPLHATRAHCCSCRFDVKNATEGFYAVRKYLRKYGHRYPTSQICIAEEELKYCLDIMSGNVPLVLREKARLIEL